MPYAVVHWNRATEDVYDAIRGQMPSGWSLITLEAETKAEWQAQIRNVDFMIVADWAITPEDLTAAPRQRPERTVVSGVRAARAVRSEQREQPHG